MKIKVLFVLSKKLKRIKRNKLLGDIIEAEAPDMYDFLYIYGEEETMKVVDEFRPEILFLSHVDGGKSEVLLKRIKQVCPTVQVFVILSNTLNDEQETIEKYMAAGAYKCFFSTMNIETVIHDMYVSLNLE